MGFIDRWRNNREAQRTINGRANAAMAADVVDPAGMEGVVAAVEEGRKIEAIKRYREYTGLELKQAKTDVERLMDMGDLLSVANAELLLRPTAAGHVATDDPQLASVIAALDAGRKVEAIKRYREMSRVGLKEAKEFVERLETSR